jgi:hypothetical protein
MKYDPFSGVTSGHYFMSYAKNERVKHPGKPEWGVGQVLEHSSSSQVRVFFVGAGERKLSLEHVQLQRVTATAANHVLLDNLTLAPGDDDTYVSLREAMAAFLTRFPQGFYGKKYLGKRPGIDVLTV